MRRDFDELVAEAAAAPAPLPFGDDAFDLVTSRHPVTVWWSEIARAGLDVVDLRTARLRIEFRDVGAVVWFLRKVIWMVPGFTVAADRDRLRDLHALIEAEDPFVGHSTRYLIEARAPR